MKNYFENPFEESDPFESVRRNFAEMQSGAAPTQRGGALDAARSRIARQIAQRAAMAPGLASETVQVGGSPQERSQAGQHTPQMLALRDYVQKQYGIKNVGGFADRNIAGTNKKSDHALWRAFDFMVGNDRAKGDAIADYIIKNHDKYGVKNLIWYDRSWNPKRGWRPYRHPGGGSSPTLQHRDHPHVSFY